MIYNQIVTWTAFAILAMFSCTFDYFDKENRDPDNIENRDPAKISALALALSLLRFILFGTFEIPHIPVCSYLMDYISSAS